ncbi:MAG: hypothetical protein WC284_18975 [Candidimonas sp.]
MIEIPRWFMRCTPQLIKNRKFDLMAFWWKLTEEGDDYWRNQRREPDAFKKFSNMADQLEYYDMNLNTLDSYNNYYPIVTNVPFSFTNEKVVFQNMYIQLQPYNGIFSKMSLIITAMAVLSNISKLPARNTLIDDDYPCEHDSGMIMVTDDCVFINGHQIPEII